MATEIQAPNVPMIRKDQPILFLAGSIEMGKAEPWQDRLVRDLASYDVILMNPRRDDWDSSWEQKMSNPQFFEQVMWEQDWIENADLPVFYFDPATMSPITLMELGHVAGHGDQGFIVCCPEGFWRKGNVDIEVARSRGGVMTTTYEEFLARIKEILDGLTNP